MDTGAVSCGSLSVVDLAGSERVTASEVTGVHLKEAQAINSSLATLGDVIAAVGRGNKHVPYRNSKLTRLLEPYLAGDCKTLMFVNISPHSDDMVRKFEL